MMVKVAVLMMLVEIKKATGPQCFGLILSTKSVVLSQICQTFTV